MNFPHSFLRAMIAAGIGILASSGFAQNSPDAAVNPYKILNSSQTMGVGGIDYVAADSDNRKIYVPRGNQVLVFDLDTLKPAGAIPGLKGGHGVAIDSASGHAFSSSNPVLMWDAKSLQPITNIAVTGRPDGILFEPFTERVYVLSHVSPNVTAIDGKDGSIVGTLDLGGGPEQAQSDGQGAVYIDIEDKDSIAVVDAKTFKVTTNYDLGGKGGGPGGLGLDAKNKILFAFCHNPATCVVLSATDGKILATLPIGRGTDGGGFNPNTMEAFSSQGDGTLTIIKENSPTDFAVEQTVKTKPRAKTCTLDTKNNAIVLIAVERPAAPPATNAGPAAVSQPGGGLPSPAGGPGGDRPRGGRNNGPGLLDILVVGR